MIGSYLSSTSVSPLKEAFVNIPEPLATDIDISTYEFNQPAINVQFEDVPVEKLEEIEGKFKEEIQKIVDDGPEKFDMDRLHTISEISLINCWNYLFCIFFN